MENVNSNIEESTKTTKNTFNLSCKNGCKQSISNDILTADQIKLKCALSNFKFVNLLHVCF